MISIRQLSFRYFEARYKGWLFEKDSYSKNEINEWDISSSSNNLAAFVSSSYITLS